MHTQPDDIEDDGKITVDGDEVQGMTGGEEVHGAANVAGNAVTFAQNKKNARRITGLYANDPLPTWSWTEGYGNTDGENLNALGQVGAIMSTKGLGVRDGEDMGLSSVVMDGKKIDFSQTEEEKKAYEQSFIKDNSWVNKQNLGSDRPEIYRLRDHLKKGVLSYSQYMADQISDHEREMY